MSAQQTAKQLQYFDACEKMFVEEGLTIDAIAAKEEVKVSRKTLYNWRESGGWDDKRARFVKLTGDLRTDVMQMAREAVKRALEDPKTTNVFAAKHALSAVKMLVGYRALEAEINGEAGKEAKGRSISPETIREIEEKLGLL